MIELCINHKFLSCGSYANLKYERTLPCLGVVRTVLNRMYMSGNYFLVPYLASLINKRIAILSTKLVCKDIPYLLLCLV